MSGAIDPYSLTTRSPFIPSLAVKGKKDRLLKYANVLYGSINLFRKASFVGNFNEDEQRSGNIRYFFPDGCKGSDIKMAPIVLPIPTATPVKIFIKEVDGIKPPETKIPPFIQPQPPTVVVPPFTPAPVTNPPTRKPVLVTFPPTPRPIPPVTPKPVIVETPKVITRIPVPIESILRVPSNQVKDSCQKSCCSDDENVAKLILPIPMKSFGKSAGSCESFAKLIIPVDGLNPDSLRSLTRGSDTSELIRTVLQSLS